MDNTFRENSISTLRIIAAIQVVYVHSMTHLGIEFPELLTNILKVFMGVPFFFATSGFLIWRSLDKYSKEGYSKYIKSRFYRIYPELWIAVIISLISIIIFLEKIDWAQFGLFTLGQCTVFQFWTPSFLRPFGCGTPNGSLWTISILIQFYIFALPLHRLLRKKRAFVWLGGVIVAVLIKALNPLIAELLPTTIYKLYRITLIPHFYFFILGMFISEYWDKCKNIIKNKWWIFGILLIAMIFFVRIDIDAESYGVMTYTLQFLTLIGFAYSCPQIRVKRDVSYGVYLYHMIIINILLELGISRGNYLTFAEVLSVSLLFAYISSYIPKAFQRLAMSNNK